MHTVTKKELIDRIAESTGMKHVQVKKVVQGFLDAVIEELSRGNRLEFRDFGVFEVRQRKTMEKVHVPAKRTVRFKAGRLMKLKLQPPEQSGPAVPVEPPSAPAPEPPGGGMP